MSNFSTRYWIYNEFIFIINDYYSLTGKKEMYFSIAIPILSSLCISILATLSSLGVICIELNVTPDFINALINFLGIIVGFSITCLTVLVTASNQNIEKLKNNVFNKRLNSKEVSLHKVILIGFSYSILSQFLILAVCLIVYAFFSMYNFKVLLLILTCLGPAFLLHIVAVAVINFSNLYFTVTSDSA